MDDWQKMIRDYGPMVYTTAWRILRHRQDVEDVVQDVFLHAWRTRHEEPVVQWGGWLRRLAVCRALDRVRLRRPMIGLGTEPAATHNSPAESIQLDELQEQLRIAVADLPERERIVFSLRYFESLSNSEIAEALSISQSAVSTALNKARGKLAASLHPAIQGDLR